MKSTSPEHETKRLTPASPDTTNAAAGLPATERRNMLADIILHIKTENLLSSLMYLVGVTTGIIIGMAVWAKK